MKLMNFLKNLIWERKNFFSIRNFIGIWNVFISIKTLIREMNLHSQKH